MTQKNKQPAAIRAWWERLLGLSETPPQIQMARLEDRVLYSATPLEAAATDDMLAPADGGELGAELAVCETFAALDAAQGTAPELVDDGFAELEDVHATPASDAWSTVELTAVLLEQALADDGVLPVDDGVYEEFTLDVDAEAAGESAPLPTDFVMTWEGDGGDDMLAEDAALLAEGAPVPEGGPLTWSAPVELVLVDTGVENYEALVDELRAAAERPLEVLLIDSTRDGVQQIGELLAGYDQVTALHLVTHGTDGAVKLGDVWLTADNLTSYAGAIAQWQDALTADADILLYACDLTASDDGVELLAGLQALTGAEIAASDDTTGSARFAGDWELEHTLGAVETAGLFSADHTPAWDGLLATFTVTNTNDSGAGSLRQAILDANALAGADTITFAVSDALVGGAHTISLFAALPDITDVVVLDGWSEADYSGAPIIVLNGASAGGADGLTLAAGSGGSTIRGLVIQQFYDGIVIESGSDGNTLVGNYLGTSASGLVDRGNTHAGLYVQSAGNQIGGDTAEERNLISGNDGYGVYVGVGDNNVFTGNWIGVDSTGNVALANTFNGIYLGSSTGNLIGGVGLGEGNVISGHGDIGLRIEGGSGHVIQGNLIGVGADGVTALGNLAGVSVLFGGTDIVIGGTVANAGNVIANNGRGVQIGSNTTSNVAVLGNSIYGNTQLGIDLEIDGVTANDTSVTPPIPEHDADPGPNGLQNYPVLTSVVTGAGDTEIGGSLQTSPNTAYRIEFFSAPGADASGHGEGQSYLGFANVVTDAAGEATFSLTLTGIAVTAGHVVSATATADLGGGAFGGSSEFSAAMTVISNQAPTIRNGGIESVDAVNGTSFALPTSAAFRDADGDLLTYTITGLPAGLTYDAATGLISGVIPADASTAGPYAITVSVTDGVSPAVEETFTITGHAVPALVHSGAWTTTATGGSTTAGGVTITVDFSAALGGAITAPFNETLESIPAFAADALQGAASLRTVFNWDAAPETATAAAADDGVTGEFTISFSETVTNPIFHLDRLGGFGGFIWNSMQLTLLTPGVALEELAGTASFVVDEAAGTIQREGVGEQTNTDGSASGESSLNWNIGTAAGSVRLVGTFSSVKFLLQAALGSIEGAGGDGIEIAFSLNEAPTATGDGYATGENSPLSGNLITDDTGLGVDSDPEGDALTVVEVNGVAGDVGQPIALASGALLTVNADGSFSYDPGSVFDSLTDGNTYIETFSYTIADENGGQATAFVAITVMGENDDPTANDDWYGVAEYGSLNESVPGVLGNDSDPEGDTLYAYLVSGPSQGSLSFNSDGSFSYSTWASNTTDSFTYYVSDGTNNSGTATVYLTIGGGNGAPSASDDWYGVAEYGSLNESVPGVLGNDSDPEGDTLQAYLVSGPSQGSLTFNSDGSFSYSTWASNTTDSFTYYVSDGTNNSGTATVYLTIGGGNGAPSASDDWYGVAEYGSLNESVPGVLGNDSDPEGDTLQAYLVSGPSQGSLTFNSDGSFSYSTWASNTTDSFTYYVSDGTNNSNVATVFLSVGGVDDPPVVVTSGAFVQYNENFPAVAIDPGLALSDPDSALLIGATVQITSAYVNGEDVLSFVDQLGITGSWSAATGTLTLSGAATVADYETALRAVTFHTTSEDPSIAARTMSFVVNDGVSNSAAATQQVSVVSWNDAPTTTDASASGVEDAPSIAITLLGGDVDGMVDRFMLSGLPADGVLYLDAGLTTAVVAGVDYAASGQALTLYFAPTADWSGVTSFQFAARDAQGMYDATPATATITVTAGNDAPAITSNGGGATAATSLVENSLTVTVVTSSDIDGGAPVYSISGGADAALFTIDANTGVLSFVLAPDYETPADFDGDNVYQVTVAVSDGAGGTDTQAIAVTIQDLADSGHYLDQFNTTSYSNSDGTLNWATSWVEVDSGGGGAFGGDIEAPTPFLRFRPTVVGNSLTREVDLGAAATSTFSFSVVYNVLDAFGAVDVQVSGDGGLNFDTLLTVTSATPLGSYQFDISAYQAANTQIRFYAAAASATGIRIDDVQVSVVPNAAPTITSDGGGVTAAVGAAENSTAVTTVTASDPDPPPQPLSYSISGGADAALFVIDANTGVLAFLAAPDRENALDFDGDSVYEVTVRVSDGAGGFDTQAISVAVTDLNEFSVGPVSDVDGAANTVAENAANGSVVGVTAWATDGDATNNTVTYTLTDDAGGRFAIDLNTGVITVANGLLLDYETATSHSVTVQATSADGSNSVQTLVIALVDQNDNAPQITAGQSFTVAENSANGTSLGVAVATDADTVGSLTGWTIVGGSGAGVFAIDAVTGEITVVGSAFLNYEAVPSFTLLLQVSDGPNTSAPVQVTVDLTDVNDPPVLTVNNALALSEGATATLTAAELAASDEDHAASQLTYNVLVNPANGRLELATNPGVAIGSFTQADVNAGLVRYVHDGGETTADSFQFQVSDAAGGTTAAATFNLSISPANDVPQAVGENYSVAEDGSLTVAASGVLANDSDAEGDPLTAVLVQAPTNGVLSLNADGSFSYTPNPDFFGVDSFTYQASDGGGPSTPVTVTIDVTPVNDAPQANADNYATTNIQQLTLPVAGVLVNDSDLDGDPLTAILVQGPGRGVLALNANGSFSYTPDVAFTGVVSFTYQVSDGVTSSGPATVTITISAGGAPPPPDNGFTDEGDSSPNEDSPEDLLEEEPDDVEGDDPPDVLPEEEARSDDEAGGVGASAPAGSAGLQGWSEAEPAGQPKAEPETVLTRQHLTQGYVLTSVTNTTKFRVGAARVMSRMLTPAELAEASAIYTFEAGNLIRAIDQMRDAAAEREALSQVVVGSATVLMSSLSVGYVLWALRGSYLMAVMFASLPSWMTFDPLPVLSTAAAARRREDGESLAEIVRGQQAQRRR